MNTSEGAMNMCHIFIPSYHRPNNLKTIKYLAKIGWDMRLVYVFIDSEAEDAGEYEATAGRYGFNLHVFDMDEARKRYDYVHRPSKSRRSAGQARNMFQDFAKSIGIDFYCVIDDDTEYYGDFRTRRVLRNTDIIKQVFHLMELFMRKRKVGVMGFPQSGDYIGGYKEKLFLRKIMNTTFYLLPYIYRAERGVQDDDTSLFAGVINEGLFAGTLLHSVVLQQHQSAVQNGGLTDLYNECKLLNKSLITPIQFPSAIFAERQEKNGGRLHHRITYKYLGPVIIRGTKEHDNIAWDTYPEDYPYTNENKHDKHKER